MSLMVSYGRNDPSVDRPLYRWLRIRLSIWVDQFSLQCNALTL